MWWVATNFKVHDGLKKVTTPRRRCVIEMYFKKSIHSNRMDILLKYLHARRPGTHSGAKQIKMVVSKSDTT